MDSPQDFKTLRESIQGSLVAVTRSANSIANEDLQFQRTAHPLVGNSLDNTIEGLLQLATGVIKSAAQVTGQKAVGLDDVDDVEIQWRGIVDVVDSLLEKADTSLDEYTGLVKRKDVQQNDESRNAKRPKSTPSQLDWSLKRANILKPQNTFERKTNNYEEGPWKPLLSTKPHAQVSLEESLTTFVDEEGNTQYKHPYEPEIVGMQYPKSAYETREARKYLPAETTQAIWVDTWEGVLKMLEELKGATEIAVDLEHHDFRTYTGLLCLMQISTREKDWIIDTLVPWRHKLEILNQVFTDPRIIKVFHGAYMDIIWLQRDLGLYIVGLFDTYFACDILQYPGKSLAFLLKKFVDFDADKKFQMADWRIRPLPEEMLYYARSDTHYLLYIYDMVRNELVAKSDQTSTEKNKIDWAIQRSKEIALQRYAHPARDADNQTGPRGWYNPLLKCSTFFDSEQLSVYRAVHNFRDEIARREDESPMFIMSQQAVFNIAKLRPSDKKALWSLLGSHARGLGSRFDELFDLVQKARADGMIGPSSNDLFRLAPGSLARLKKTGKESVSAEIEADAPKLEDLRSDKTQLWGDMPMSSIWDRDAQAAKPPADEKLVIPITYHQFVENTAEQATPAEPKPLESNEPLPEPVASPPEEDGGFTLKKGRKRKAPDAEIEERPDSEAEADVEMGDVAAESEGVDEGEGAKDEDVVELGIRTKKRKSEEEKEAKRQRKAERKAKKEAQAEEKAQERAAKKAAKKLAKEQREQQETEGDEEEEAPFDYAQASSVLHAGKAENGGDGQAKKNRKKAFDPYTSKTGNAPQGAKKMNYEKKGRTATFKK